MNYKYIINPVSNKSVLVNSKLGTKILINYLTHLENTMSGGG